MLHVWNPLGAWWGEGDEKIYIDGEKFPSTFGTGSEDYFGYAWCNPTLFTKPYHAQSISENNAGHVSVNRFHISDQIPFQSAIEADIEKYKAQLAGIEKIRAGAKACEPDLAARKIIDDSEFKGTFIHSFGHGIGMDVHQAIGVHPKSEQILKAGNIISAEPGIYISGVGGIRIEDTVLVTEDGCRILTDYDHDLTIV